MSRDERRTSWWENRTPEEKIKLLQGWIFDLETEAASPWKSDAFRERQSVWIKDYRLQVEDAEVEIAKRELPVDWPKSTPPEVVPAFLIF